jgi:hypothetical protein
MELCNIELPYPVDGESFVEMMRSSGNNEAQDLSGQVAYGYFRDGISLRTDRYRITKYFRTEKPVIELYDHLNDPQESVNIAKMEPEIVLELLPILDIGNTGLYE